LATAGTSRSASPSRTAAPPSLRPAATAQLSCCRARARRHPDRPGNSTGGFLQGIVAAATRSRTIRVPEHRQQCDGSFGSVPDHVSRRGATPRVRKRNRAAGPPRLGVELRRKSGFSNPTLRPQLSGNGVFGPQAVTFGMPPRESLTMVYHCSHVTTVTGRVI
jgi:hypothetical protein